MKRIFIAGRYSADNVIDILTNIAEGTRLSTEILLLGYAPFCPWFDYQFHLYLRDNETLSLSDYYNYTMEWLRVSDAVLVLSNSKNS